MADQDLNGMTDEQLEDEAHKRGLTVTGLGGGTPTREDYLRALTPPIAGAEAKNIAKAKASKIDETVPGGRYVTAQGKWVNSHGQEIDKDTAKPVDGSATKTNEQTRY